MVLTFVIATYAEKSSLIAPTGLFGPASQLQSALYQYYIEI